MSTARRDAGLLALLLLILAGVLVAWLAVDRRPPEWDHANRLERALDCHRIPAAPGRDRYAEIVAMWSFYPPLVLCAAGLSYFVLPLPSLVVDGVWRHLDPTPRLRRLPVAVTLATPRILPGRLEIGGEAGAATR